MNLPSFCRAGLTATLLLLTCLGLAQHPTGTGLRGQYYAGRNFEQLVLTRLDPGIDFNWTIGPTGEHFVAPGPGVPGEFFSVRWSGHLYAPVTGYYTFQIATDDGMRVWIGGQKVLDSWQNQPVTLASTHLQLQAGRYYSLRVEYYQSDRDSRAQLAWQLPNTPAEPTPIPAANLYQRLPTTAVPLVEATPAPVRPATPRPPTVRPVKPALVIGRRPTPAAPAKPTPISKPNPVPKPRPASAPAPPVAAAAPEPVLPDLTALSKGAAVTLPNLYFTQSTAALLPTSRPTLNELARTLREQPDLRLEIAGHTDNVGEAHLNLRLSEQRARVVRRYLLQQGIDSARLTARGYGGIRPVADNRDPQLRPRNRRVEVVVQ